MRIVPLGAASARSAAPSFCVTITDGIVIVDGSTADSRRRRSAAIGGLIADATSGELTVEIAKTFPLEQAGQALAELAGPHSRGKFVLLP